MIESRLNVLVTPYERAWVGGPDHRQIPHHGRIIKGNETEDEFPARLRRVAASDMAGHYLYGGPFKLHFGHVMVDSIIRLWAFDRNRHNGVIFPALSERRHQDGSTTLSRSLAFQAPTYSLSEVLPLFRNWCLPNLAAP